MFGMFESVTLLIGGAYMLLVGFVLWLYYRFVKAHESIADEITDLVKLLKEKKLNQ